MIRCSVCILTYNSAETLRHCLESVKEFADIIIMDGGSVDHTLKIAKEYNARVYPQRENEVADKIQDFTAVRQKLFNLAKEDWRLWLDSDEWLSEEAVEKIKNITDEELESKLYSFQRKAIIGDRIVEYMYCYPEYCNRLFNKNVNISLKKDKKVHEDLVVGEGAAIEKLNEVIYHFWEGGYAQLKKKDDYYLELSTRGKCDFPLKKKIRVACINVLKGFKVFAKSFFVYLRYGFKKTLPIKYSWRFARYHFLYAKKILRVF